MIAFFRNARKGLRRLFNVTTVRLDGVVISTHPSDISRRVRNEVFKGTYEQPESMLVREFLSKGDRVLEIGGGVGFISLLCARICGPENVLTYEANSGMQSPIKVNQSLNGLAPQVRFKAITVAEREVTFYINDNIISSSLHHRDHTHPHKVPADPLDEVIAEWKPTAIVMDIEGAETMILPTSQLNGVKKIILELHPHIVGEPETAAMKSHLEKLGFHEERTVYKSSCFLRQ
ncbi:MAG TPA: FkbM family methyltransferase [Verrucomicrobiae bacterium]|jgi:FkbM family methyltransferase